MNPTGEYNPTGDKLTTELQHSVHIEKPAVEGMVKQELHTTTGQTLEEGVDMVGSGVKFTGDTLGSGIDTVGSGVQYTGEKVGAGIQYTGEKIGEGIKLTGEIIGEGVHLVGSGVKATGRLIGAAVESVAPTIAAGGDKVESAVQKGAEIVEEERARIQLPGAVTLIQSGATRLYDLLTGQARPNPNPLEEEKIPIAPAPSITDKVVVVEEAKDIAPETIVHAQTTVVGDTITTSIATGHWTETNPTRFDIVRDQLASGIVVHDTKGVRTDLRTHEQETKQETPKQETPKQETSKQETQQLPNLTKTDVHDAKEFLTQAEEQILETKQETQQLPNLTKKDVHDAKEFLAQAEEQSSAPTVETRKPETQKSEQQGDQSEQLPNLTKKDVQDAAIFIDQVEHQNVNVSPKGQKRRSVSDKVQPPQTTEGGKGSDLPNLRAKNVKNASTFLDTVEKIIDTVDNSQ